MSPKQPTVSQAPRPANPATAASPTIPAQQQVGGSRQDLYNQLEHLETRRQGVAIQMRNLRPGSPEVPLLGDQMVSLDRRIAIVEQMLSSSAAEGSQITVVPSQPVPSLRQGPPEDFYIVGAVVMMAVFFPLSIAYTRRIWTRGTAGISNIAGEIVQRLERMERSMDVTAVEVERIGEGQRFLTRLLSQGDVPQVLESAMAEGPAEEPLKHAP